MVKVSSSVTIGAATVSPPVVVSVRGIVRVDAETVDVEVTVDAEIVVFRTRNISRLDKASHAMKSNSQDIGEPFLECSIVSAKCRFRSISAQATSGDHLKW
jgi:hypothetical protein